MTKDEMKKQEKAREKQLIEDRAADWASTAERFEVFKFIEEKFDTIIKSFQTSFENACESVAEIEAELEEAKQLAESAQTYLILSQQLRNHFNQDDYETYKRMKIKASLAQPDMPKDMPKYDKETGGFSDSDEMETFLEMCKFWKEHARAEFDARKALEELEKQADQSIVENAAKSLAELEQEAIAEEKARCKNDYNNPCDCQEEYEESCCSCYKKKND